MLKLPPISQSFVRREPTMSQLNNSFTFTTHESELAEHYVNAVKYFSVLVEFRSDLRNKLKHGDYTLEQQQALEEIWQEFHDLLKDNDVHNV